VNKITLKKFMERWLAHIRPQVVQRTFERYEEIAIKNITPMLGSIIIDKLKPMQISDACATALVSGRRDGKGGPSARTVGHIHRVLKQALAQAVRWEMLIRNPADAVDPPRSIMRRSPTAMVCTWTFFNAAAGSTPRWAQ
jgi:hypothetical protein